MFVKKSGGPLRLAEKIGHARGADDTRGAAVLARVLRHLFTPALADGCPAGGAGPPFTTLSYWDRAMFGAIGAAADSARRNRWLS